MNEIDHLLYMNYLAEQEMLDKLSVIELKRSCGVLSEATEIQLNEDVKDTVMTAIRKIIANIQVVWNKFKATVGDAIAGKIEEQYAKYLETDFVLKVPEKYPIPLLSEYDKMLAVNVPVFQESMTDQIKDGSFTRSYFSYFIGGDNEDFKTVVKNKVFKTAGANGADTINKENIKEYRDFLKNYKAKADAIADDIKNLNSSSRTIENLLNQTTINASANISGTHKYYFNEADDDKESFSDANKQPDDDKSENDNKEEKAKKSDLNKQINEFFKICNQVLSTKFIITNQIRSGCTTMIMQFGSIQAKNAKSGNTQDNNQNTNSGEGSTTVNI